MPQIKTGANNSPLWNNPYTVKTSLSSLQPGETAAIVAIHTADPLHQRLLAMGFRKFIVAGVVLVWLLTHLPPSAAPASANTLSGMIGAWLQPLFHPIGITPELTIALIFGFVAKEIVIGSLAVIYGLGGEALSHSLALQLDWVQAYSFMLFTLIYTPCLSTIATLRSESKNTGFMLFTIAWSLLLAWAVSFVFYQGARMLGY